VLTAAGAAIAILVIVLVQMDRAPLSAAELIARSTASDRARVADANIVVHRAWRVEARRLPEGRLLSRRRVEVWQRGGGGITIRRAFDTNNHIVAGEWQEPDGGRALYARGSSPTHVDATQSTSSTRSNADATPSSLNEETAWRADVSAAAFLSLLPAAPRLQMTTTDAAHVVEYQQESGDGLVRARLRMRRDDLRAIEQAFVVRAHGVLTEFRFSEETFARVPAAQVLASVFQPDAELLAPPAPLASAPVAARAAAPVVSAATTTTLDRLEFDAWYQLHRLDRCVDGVPQIARQRTRIRVRVAPTDERCREQIVAAFSSSGSPANAIAVDIVSPHVSANTSGVATWALERAAEAVRHATALQRVVDRWPPESLRGFDLDTAANWQNMVRRDARRIGQEMKALRTQLLPIFLARATETLDATDAPIEPLRSADDVPRAVARLTTLVRESHDAVRRLFETTTHDDGHDDPRSPDRLDALTRALREAEQIASGFDEPWDLPHQ
jgi:hypothetical protein